MVYPVQCALLYTNFVKCTIGHLVTRCTHKICILCTVQIIYSVEMVPSLWQYAIPKHRLSLSLSFSLAAGGSVWRQTVAMVQLPCGWCLTQTGPHTVSRRTRGESLCWTCVMAATVLFTAPSVQHSHCF